MSLPKLPPAPPPSLNFPVNAMNAPIVLGEMMGNTYAIWIYISQLQTKLEELEQRLEELEEAP